MKRRIENSAVIDNLEDIEQIVPIEEILEGEIKNEKLPYLPSKLRRFVFDYLISINSNKQKKIREWADQYSVHYKTIQNWLVRNDVRQYLQVVESNLSTYLKEALNVIAKETVAKWFELIKKDVTEKNLDTMRKIVFEGVELLRGHLPAVGVNEEDHDDQFSDCRNLTLDELKSKIDELEILGDDIEEDSDF